MLEPLRWRVLSGLEAKVNWLVIVGCILAKFFTVELAQRGVVRQDALIQEAHALLEKVAAWNWPPIKGPVLAWILPYVLTHACIEQSSSLSTFTLAVNDLMTVALCAGQMY